MTTMNVPQAQAKQGVKINTNQRTTIQVQTASIKALVGGLYADHPYGHTALRVITQSGERIYDYGRDGKTWGVGNSEGEGILNIWTSFDSYIAEENSLKRKTTGFLYEVSEEQAEKINQFYEGKIASKKPNSAGKVKASYVIDDYYALGPNCTTLSVDAAKVAMPDLDTDWKKYQDGRGLSMIERGIVSARGWPGHIFMPVELQAMLSGTTARKPKAVQSYEANK
ncbi:MAG: hypothetical protein GAK35_03734 [Herbaspirillum frisingense]|uniref:Uncharacterized protein n=1 Tax=Herbaspirillum frisingense TaxID=92645 RepID=A0A7V8FTN9_9BURK|nr:MAG: hypothetical protein GAK35_03734 [Herbaspirillum frisingense]